MRSHYPTTIFFKSPEPWVRPSQAPYLPHHRFQQAGLNNRTRSTSVATSLKENRALSSGSIRRHPERTSPLEVSKRFFGVLAFELSNQSKGLTQTFSRRIRWCVQGSVVVMNIVQVRNSTCFCAAGWLHI
ncbi:hypothetical protein BJX70DRAFT_383536 [Aspergillus crustosus]